MQKYTALICRASGLWGEGACGQPSIKETALQKTQYLGIKDQSFNASGQLRALRNGGRVPGAPARTCKVGRTPGPQAQGALSMKKDKNTVQWKKLKIYKENSDFFSLFVRGLPFYFLKVGFWYPR